MSKPKHKAVPFNYTNLIWCIENRYIEQVDWEVGMIYENDQPKWYIFFYNKEKATHCKLACV
jgi:hypothetical protein